MPTFDVSSELDMQEVRNAVDQAAREIHSRYDFKNTGSEVALGDGVITLRSSNEDRLAAARPHASSGEPPARMAGRWVTPATAIPGASAEAAAGRPSR